MKYLPRTFGMLTAATALFFAQACATNEPVEQRSVTMTIDASSHEILTGEIVTLQARTENTLGKDSVVKWSSIGGDIKTEESGRTARVRFKKPGMYTVTARLYVDDRVMREDSVDIRVKPVN